MAKHHRIFIGFAIEDKFARDNLVFQAKQSRTPFEFTDMSVKTPWENSWKTQCRERIKGCDGMIAMLSSNTLTADGALWEIRCAAEEGVPLIGLRIYKDRPMQAIPTGMSPGRIFDWTWPNVSSFLSSL
jgi:hypothetical protein